MIIDKQNMFSDEQAITATANSTNVVDLGVADQDPGEPLHVNIQAIETFTAAGSATLTVALQTSVDEAFTAPITLLQTGALAVADLEAGYHTAISTLGAGVKQYVRLVYTVATGPMTAGKVTAFIGGPRQSNI